MRRLAQLRFERMFPDAPWLTASAVRLLDSWLKPSDHGLEWGSGRSTIWFAKRMEHLISVEHTATWHAQIKVRLNEQKLSAKVDYRHIPCELSEQDEPESHPYCNVADELPDESLDFALVDGMIRTACMRRVQSKIKPGGLLALDNANRYVPNLSLGRYSTIHVPRNEPASSGWVEVLRQLENWRAILTTDGIWDTRFWVKPG
jgi:hypothetical protein